MIYFSTAKIEKSTDIIEKVKKNCLKTIKTAPKRPYVFFWQINSKIFSKILGNKKTIL
jgi:hypothetical protein